MGIFKNYSGITYNFTSRTDATEIIETIQDLTTKVNIIISQEDLEKMCVRYSISSNSLPENVSNDFYGTTEYDWTILFINGIGDLNSEWPLNDLQLVKYATEKYGAPYLYDVHHYEKLPERVIMDEQFIIDTYGSDYLNPVTNIEHETNLNEQKRYIYVIKAENISTFVTNFKEALK